MSNGLTGALADRKGYPILTFTGSVVYPLDARPDEIRIEDIAHALANICRYTGHVSGFYSVAEHCVRVSELLESKASDWVFDPDDTKQLALEGLLHDASEAYIGDVARPIKASAGVGELYEEAEDRLMLLIADRFGVTWPMIEAVRWADNVLLRTEQRDLMPYPNTLYSLDEYEMLDEHIRPWGPQEAESEFLNRYAELTS